MPLSRPKLKVALGYAAFGVAAFVLGLYLTFPYDALERFVEGQAAQQGFSVQMDGLGPGLFGVTATGVQIAPRATGDKPAQPLKVDSVAVRPSLFPLGVALRGQLMGGSFHADVGGLGDLVVHADFDGLDPAQGNFKGFTGIAAKGSASGTLELTMPRNAPGLDGKPHDPNLAEANGGLELTLGNFSIEGGQVTVPVYGTPTPVDLPKIIFGNLEAKLAITKGNAKLEQLRAKSSDLDLSGSGTIHLARRLAYSETNLELKLMAEPEFVKRLGLLGSGISMLPPAPGAPGYRLAHITGFLGNPQLAQR